MPCGQCIGCRVAKSQDWATRIAHEAALHRDNSFVTLTFDDAHLPASGVQVRHVQLFMKRLRKAREPQKIRFFACGEYGEMFSRPHYHVILFGYRPDDMYPWRRTKSGFVCSRSPELERVWPYGHVEVGSVTVQSAAYVARYVVKKISGDAAEQHYRKVCALTGEIRRQTPEFIVMSTRPGIGAAWWETYGPEALPSDFVVIDGARRPVPRYYKRKFDAAHENAPQIRTPVVEVRASRMDRARDREGDTTPDRLEAREGVALLRLDHLKREFEG